MRVVTESAGYWTVEALEEFEDQVDGNRIAVKVGEQRIVPPTLLYKQKSFPPMVKEHAYELEMEKKVKQMVRQEEQTKAKLAQKGT